MKFLETTKMGRRGAFLLFLTILDLIYASALAFPTERAISSPSYAFLARLMPLWVWAAFWAVTGFICLLNAFKFNDAPGYAAAMFIKVFWALLFLLGWIFSDVERGYLSTAIWGAFAGVLAIIATWPDDKKIKARLKND